VQNILTFFQNLPATVQLAGWVILLAITFLPQAAKVWYGAVRQLDVTFTPKASPNVVAAVKQAIIEDKAK